MTNFPAKDQFNEWAVRLGFPFSWAKDEVNPGRLDLDKGELVIVGVDREVYVKNGTATGEFERAAKLITDAANGIHPDVLKPAQRKLLEADLAKRKLSIQSTRFDAKNYTERERKMVGHIIWAAHYLEQAFLLQRHPEGVEFARQVYAQGDPLAIELLVSNHGPWCEKIPDPDCVALPGIPPRKPGAHLYPARMDADGYKALKQLPNGENLTSPFVAVEKNAAGSKYYAIPFGIHPLFRQTLEHAAMELRYAAVHAVAPDGASPAVVEEMRAFQLYLIHAANGLLSDKPWPFDEADEAWVKMPAGGKWFLRFAPDEQDWDAPIKGHAGYQVHFGIFDPVAEQGANVFKRYGIQKMEADLADLIGSDVYKARTVSEKTPLKFVREVFAAGNGRPSHYGIAGFSLPNWGPHAMGAKVIFTNENAATFERMGLYVRAFLGDKYVPYLQIGAATANTVVHEYFHGFGPQNETVEPAIGRGLQRILEETKASAVPLWFNALLAKAGLITKAEQKSRAVAHAQWIFSFVSRGLHDPNGNLKTYETVATIMLGHFMAEGAVTYDKKRKKWDLNFDELPMAAAGLVKTIGGIQATGDKTAGEALVQRFVKDPAQLKKIRHEEIGAIARSLNLVPMATLYQVVID